VTLPTSSPYDALIQTVANTYGLPNDLLRAQVFQESSFDPMAFRYEKAFFDTYIRHKPEAKGYAYGPLAACSFGLLQILLETALEIGYNDEPQRLFTPQVGLSWGARYLQLRLQHASGDYHAALMAYNGSGPQAAAYADRIYTLAGRAA
jgi:soluble lytic murein transglycosylase-like protein